MKSIFTKLTTLLLSGAVVLVGCTDFSADIREVNKNLEDLKGAAATKAEVAALKTEVQDLTQKINDQYATKAEVTAVETTVKAVQKELTDAKAALEAALANKADKTALETAVADLQKAVADAKTELNTAIEAAKTEIAGAITELLASVGDLETELETLGTDVETLETNLEGLATRVETLETQFTSASEKLAEYQAKVDAELKEIQDGFEQRGLELDKKFAGIEEGAAGLAASIKAVNDLLLEKVAGLETEDEKIYEALEAIEENIDEIADDLQDQVDDIWDEIDAILGDLTVDYAAIETRLTNLEDALAALTSKVDVLETELRSIVSVPQVVVNGVNAVEFKSLSYVPMTDSDVVTDAATANPSSVKSIELPAYGYFRFNPSSFALANADYSIVSEEVTFITKAASEEPVAIKNISEENGKVKVEFTRGAGANMFALAATLKSNNAVVYSDYVLAYDNALTAKDIVISGNGVVETYEAAKNAEPVAKLDAGATFSVADYVKISGIEGFGLTVNYSVANGKVSVADGIVTAEEKAAATNSIIKIEVIDNGSVVRRAYVNVRVKGDVKYLNVSTKAVMAGSRVSFSFDKIDDWAIALKDQPNTLERVKEALSLVINQDYFSAITALGGIPGFFTEYMTFEGVGQARAKVDHTAAGYIDSQLSKINEINTVDDLVAYIEHIENLYSASDLKAQVDETIGHVIDYIVPSQYQDNIIYEWVKTNLFNWKFSDMFNFDNDVIVEIPLVGQTNVSQWAREKIDAVLASSSPLRSQIQETLVNVVGGVEDLYKEYIDSENEIARTLAENAAKSTAILEARAVAQTAAAAQLAAVNDANVADLKNGAWGTMLRLLNSDFSQSKFEEYGLGEVYTVLVSLSSQVENLVKYTPGTYTYPEEFETITEEIVYE